MNKFKTSLIISTYNRVDALLVCLDSVRHQTILPNEVVVGDDGSTFETRDAIEKIKENYPVPLIHVWHEDNGFQLAKMRNKSVAKATGDYIIEVDGDLMLSSNFVEDHLYLAEEGYYLKGGRCNLNEKLTAEICKAGKYRPIHLWTKDIDAKRENILRNRLLLSFLALRYRTTSSPALGCNMSFWKKDFININGYDEFYVGWGSEDYDFASRLQRLGIKKKYLKFGGNVYHLWHEDKYMDNADKNFLYMDEQNKKGTIQCRFGIDQYL